jgi:hypothetical protein
MAHRVQLAASPLGGLPGVAAAWHTSVLVDGQEFSFSDAGITVSQGAASHNGIGHQGAHRQLAQGSSGQWPAIIDVGTSVHSGRDLFTKLEQHFLPGTYDLLRKNCNSFSDIAMFYLVGKRLDGKYRTLEQIGAGSMGLFQAASQGQYTPNPQVQGFDHEGLIQELDPGRVWRTPGQTTGGSTRAQSREAVRGARLAHFHGSSTASETTLRHPADQLPGHEGYPQCRAAYSDTSALNTRDRQLLDDAELARKLEQEELRGIGRTTTRQTRSSATAPSEQQTDEDLARQLSDEELSRSLQAAEDRSRSSTSQTTHAGANPMPPLAQALIGGATQVLGGLVQSIERVAADAESGLARARANPGPMSEGTTAHRRQMPQHGVQDVFDRPLPPELLEEARRMAAGVPHLFGGLLNSALAPMGPAPQHAQDVGVATETLNARTVTVTADGNGAALDGRSESGSTQGDSQCMICFEGFTSGQQLRILPCMHKYHSACIDPWLRQNSLCPICKHDIRS